MRRKTMTDKSYQPVSNEAIEKRVVELPAEIYQAGITALNLKLEFLKARAKYRADFSRLQLEEKARNPEATQTDLKAYAEGELYNQYLEVIVKEGAYHGAELKTKELKDGLYALGEVSNLRQKYQ